MESSYEGKGGDAVLYYGGMRTTTEEGPVIPRPPDVPPAPMLGVNLPQPDSSTGYAARICYPTSAGYAAARGFGESAATSISGVRYCFGCGCARYGILGIKRQCTLDGPTKWDALYVYTFQVSSGRMRMHENGPADCSGFCCCLEGAFGH